MHVRSTNFAKTLVWKQDYDVKLWRHKQRTPNTNDYPMSLNETPPWKFTVYATGILTRLSDNLLKLECHSGLQKLSRRIMKSRHSKCSFAFSVLCCPRKHTNCTISLQERYFPPPLRHTQKQQFYWNWVTLPLQSSSLQSPKLNVDKPAQWLGQCGPTAFDPLAILNERGNFRATSNKMVYETTCS